MKEKSVGDILRESRVQKGLQLGDIETLTSIPSHHLLALELDQFSLIPDGLADVYLSRYAESVGLNSLDMTTLREKQEAFHDTLPVTNTVSQPVIKPAFSDDEEEVDEPAVRTVETRRRRSHRETSQKKTPWGAILLSILSLAIVVFVAYFAIKELPFNFLGKEKSAETTQEAITTETTTVETTEAATAITKEFSEGNLTVIAKTAKEESELVITLTGTESWVSVSNDVIGDQSTTLNEQQKEHKVTLKKGSSSFVTLGIPQGVEVAVDGQKVDLSDILANSPGNLTLRVE